MESKQSKIALVSGGSKGIGFAIAERLLVAGFNVYICSRSQENLVQANELLSKKSSLKELIGNLYTYRCDVTKEQDVSKLISEIENRFGYLNCLVNNSGGLSQTNTGTFNELSNNQWLEALNDNLLGAVNLTRQAYPLLKLAEKANVINISSVVAVQPGLYNPHYAAAKAGLLALSKNLSLLWADDGILVNSISPGIVGTEGWQYYIKNKAEKEDRTIDDVSSQENIRAVANVPLKRLGLPSEVADCVEFLSSNASAYITGSNIIIDGGKHRAI